MVSPPALVVEDEAVNDDDDADLLRFYGGYQRLHYVDPPRRARIDAEGAAVPLVPHVDPPPTKHREPVATR